jgi:hypothetical protein
MSGVSFHGSDAVHASHEAAFACQPQTNRNIASGWTFNELVTARKN